MEKIEVDNKDRPIEDIKIEKVHIFVDPFEEADEQLVNERAEEIEKQRKAVADELKRKQRSQPLKVFRTGIGKYLSAGAESLEQPATIAPIATTTTTTITKEDPIVKKKKTEKSFGFGNFSAW